MPTAAHCKLCGERHWSYEPHKYPKNLEVRGWAKDFVESRPSVVPVAQKFTVRDLRQGSNTVAVRSFPADQLDDEGENWVTKECEVCGSEFEAQRKTARFCSNNCRQIAHKVRKASQDKGS